MKQHLDLPFSVRRDLLKSGEIGLNDLIRTASGRLADNDGLNAFISPLTESLGADVDKMNLDLPLTGCILAVKDNIALKDVRLTCASKILDGYVSPYTATALQRLLDNGAIVIGKTNLDEFAMGSSNENSFYGLVHNPLDKSRVPGGSSGGSAAAVAAGIASAALGSDTGGSVRQPAAFCGIYGLKPTYGRVSRYGLTAFASSLDQIGVMSRTIEETTAVFQVMAGYDLADNTTAKRDIPSQLDLMCGDVEGLRIGMPKEYFDTDGIDAEVKTMTLKAAEELKKRGSKVEVCSLPHTKYSIPTYYIIAPAECSSNLARYDGVRYGLRPKRMATVEYSDVKELTNDGDVFDIFRSTRQEGFGSEVKRRIMLGTFVLSSGYYDAYYRRAQKVRRLIREDFIRVFKEFDLLLTPTTPTTAFRIGEKMNNPIDMYLSDIFTVSANLAGIPALSVPFGFDKQNLPIGVQFIANDYREDLLFRAGMVLERAEV